MSAIVFMDEDITQIGENCLVGHHTRKTDLSIAIVHAKIQGMLNRLLYHISWAFIRPVSTREKITNRLDI